MTPSTHNLDGDLTRLLARMYDERGFDFRNYKTASLKRRVTKRLNALNIPSYNEYFNLLDSDPSEYNRLLSYITIKVSEFFREPEVFEAIGPVMKAFLPVDPAPLSAQTNAASQMYAAESGAGLRIWCCACANGEEAYTLAILSSELISHAALKHTKIFATDIDSEALDVARKAEYREDFLTNVPPELVKKYFIRTGAAYKVKNSLTNIVRFGRHNIVTDRTLTKMHILFCRNLFIYFNKELQEEVFKKLDYALSVGGILVMGKSESLPKQFAHRYVQLGSNMSIYRKMG